MKTFTFSGNGVRRQEFWFEITLDSEELEDLGLSEDEVDAMSEEQICEFMLKHMNVLNDGVHEGNAEVQYLSYPEFICDENFDVEIGEDGEE